LGIAGIFKVSPVKVWLKGVLTEPEEKSQGTIYLGENIT
jgi:hypothetical protein